MFPLACSVFSPLRSRTSLQERHSHSWLGSPTFVSNQENNPQASQMEAIPQLKFPLPRNDKVCVELMNSNEHILVEWF